MELLKIYNIIGFFTVADPGTANLVITVMVSTDVLLLLSSSHCLSVQWTFEGMNITTDLNYAVSDPCGGNNRFPYTFTLTIANLTSETSGKYSAVFTTLSIPVTLPNITVTVPSE